MPASTTLLAVADGLHHAETFDKLLFSLLLAAMIACLALEEKLHARKSVIVSSFAVVVLLLGAVRDLLPFEAMDLHVGADTIHLPIYVPAIDWSVIAIILGSSLFVDVTSRSGLFTWLAIRLTKLSGGDPLRLLWAYGLMTVLFSAVLNNVTAMIIVGSLTAVSLERLGRKDKLLGFLLVEGLLTNVGGLLTLISSVPNIIVGNAAGISFVDFFLAAGPYVAVATVGTIALGAKLFDVRKLEDVAARRAAAETVAGFDERDGIESPGFFWFGATMTVAFIVAIATASVTPVVKDLGMGFVALAFAAIMLVRYKATAERFYQALDWDLLAFFVCLFVVINVMEHAQVLAVIGDALRPVIGLGPNAGPGALLGASALASSVTDNIPLAAMLSKILAGMGHGGQGVDPRLWWSVIFGANLGGNLTPIGSASTLVAVTIVHRHGLRLSFADFVRKAAPFALLQLALAVGYVLLVL
ncbi:MAG: hypothetical protein H6825_02550 [Planctomycetes bacterium]|nr:hypothetical protein [Planctomycetota bacterium]